MDEQNIFNGQLSRRRFIGYTSAAAIYTVIPPILSGCTSKSGTKPDSTFGGVKIGAITYSFRELPGTNAEDTLNYLVQCGLSHCELMSGAIEESAGAPLVNFEELRSRFMPPRPEGEGPVSSRDSVPGGRRRRPEFEMPPEFRQALEEKQKELTEWRKKCTSMTKFNEIREMYNKAGVKIHIVKFDNIGDEAVSPEEHEYMFRVAKAMGAKGITTELDEKKAEKLAPIAREHGIYIVFHNHTQLTPTTYSSGPYFSYGKYIMSNLDIGHFAAGTGQSALQLVKELAEEKRLFSIHLKDRTFSGDTVPFGQGDAQVAEILKLIQKNRWNIYCDIELEYPIPEGSDPIIETKKCVEFCRNVLS
jgi:sugar phosphate isomerase/epimerase